MEIKLLFYVIVFVNAIITIIILTFVVIVVLTGEIKTSC